MQELLARTLSQGLQAIMPAAIWLVWLRRSNQIVLVTPMRLGLLAAIPLTAIAGWLFQASADQARWESVLAIGATALVLACGLSVWHQAPFPNPHSVNRRSVLWLVAIAAALIVVRQTMVMTAAFGAAAIQMRSLDATMAVVGAAALALAAAAGWVLLGNRLPHHAVLNATRAFAAVFLAQVVFYAVHRSAEAASCHGATS